MGSWDSARHRLLIGDIWVDNLTTDELVHEIIQRARRGVPSRVFYANAHCVNVAAWDQDYRAILLAADVVYPDGYGVILASRILGEPLRARVTASDCFVDFCKASAVERIRLFLLGASPEVVEAAATSLRRRVPDLDIAGTLGGYFGPQMEDQVVDAVNHAAPDVLVVGMGVPRQEKWLHRNADRLTCPVVWGVGGLFDFLSGRTTRSPQWLADLWLEWVFRMFQEPRRMWRRYLVGNPVFLCRTILQRVRAGTRLPSMSLAGDVKTRGKGNGLHRGRGQWT